MTTLEILKKAKACAPSLAQTSTEQKNKALLAMADALESQTEEILKANAIDMEKAKGRDPYEMFLSGPISLMKITNPAADSEKRLVIFRDSYGSSITPLFIDSYSKITLVDLRYINAGMLGGFVNFENADVLFLFSTVILNNSSAFK